MNFYLSPDQRFLSTEWLDTTNDPSSDRQRVSQETETRLLADSPPARGEPSAKVTLIEFSDFQCPYCQRLHRFISALPPEEKQDLKIVFKELPLPMHNWAQKAAVAAACANLQNGGAFWRMHDFFFDHQQTITFANFTEQLQQFVKTDPSLEPDVMNECIDKDSVRSAIARDKLLAEQYHINATPTVFINGVRKVGFQTAEDLRLAIDQARRSKVNISAGSKLLSEQKQDHVSLSR